MIDSAGHRRQLDLFVDGRDAVLVYEVLKALVGRDPERTDAALRRLREEHPAHADLPALGLLADTLRITPPSPLTPGTLAAVVGHVERAVVPATRRLLGPDAMRFVRPVWETLAGAAAGLPFDDEHPFAHRAWLAQQYGDWTAVRSAVEREQDWATKPLLRQWLGLALHHSGEPARGLALCLSLCWVDPDVFARHAPASPSATIRDGWEAFERASPVDEVLSRDEHPATWFPPWLVLRHRGLVHVFREDEIPETGSAARVLRHLLSLLPLEGHVPTEEVVRKRRTLQQLSPAFFAYYLAVIGRAGTPGRGEYS
jgi:hypothetical protein